MCNIHLTASCLGESHSLSCLCWLSLCWLSCLHTQRQLAYFHIASHLKNSARSVCLATIQTQDTEPAVHIITHCVHLNTWWKWSSSFSIPASLLTTLTDYSTDAHPCVIAGGIVPPQGLAGWLSALRKHPSKEWPGFEILVSKHSPC